MSMSSKTILLVDDEASQLEQLGEALRAAGYLVLLAGDYDEAVAVYQRRQGVIDMLVTDLALPGRNGYELALTLLAIQPKLELLFTSAQAGAELHRFYGMIPPDEHFLEKPFHPTSLVRRVRDLLERPEPMSESAGASG